MITDFIVERESVGTCPPISQVKIQTSSKTGFPELPPSVASRNVSAPEVNLSESPSLTLRTSAQEYAKLAWTQPITLEEEEEERLVGSTRYDLNGNEVLSKDQSTEYKSELYHHGDQPSRPGYTIEELFGISESAFPAQKAIAIQTLGAIAKVVGLNGRLSRRTLHRILVTSWKGHIRLSVACSDTSQTVQVQAWRGLLSVIENLDRECGCMASDLASIPEFFNKLDPENADSVKVFLYMTRFFAKSDEDELEPLKEEITTAVLEAADNFNLNPNDFRCGVKDLEILVQNESTSAPEAIATLCDRIACINEEPLTREDVDLFDGILKGLKPSIPFYAVGAVDEFTWADRCNMVAAALTGWNDVNYIGVFLARFCWLFTSSLFPIECRAAVWSNTELLANISRLISQDGDDKLSLLGNHVHLDFACRDIAQVTRDNSMLLRALCASCKKFLHEHELSAGSSEMITACQELVDKLGKI